ncbi:hypothetical protein MINTM008_50220 [Mycobacterium intracellulare]|uniref:Uncharacterized protein n=1 Tax=Mycobacterium intracellulare TaxID=1767 RepID=A0A7R7RS75_MYCIT|nr:hypothetical protein MINTM002_47560 [Mycobacterium intracellulare]BCP39465.1 hypothetical protein MINTMi198_48350 [Mycobacterium intracellulare M.i.198]BCO59596.1 hypothetical protein MINTM005_48400 [Mycobacterium intracellulare]BCO64861.1 hypothetical protein MINTM006_48110 [Mycobacterium intracellulare]BCO70171.1 hypothetical protein MINTM007_47820 [Mycobacterium intracellulare]
MRGPLVIFRTLALPKRADRRVRVREARAVSKHGAWSIVSSSTTVCRARDPHGKASGRGPRE